MSLTAPEIAAACWDGLRAIELIRGPASSVTPPVQPWSRLPDWDRDDLVAIVELYRQGVTAEECYTAQRQAALDFGAEIAPSAVPWPELPAGSRERAERMFAIVQALA